MKITFQFLNIDFDPSQSLGQLFLQSHGLLRVLLERVRQLDLSQSGFDDPAGHFIGGYLRPRLSQAQKETPLLDVAPDSRGVGKIHRLAGTEGTPVRQTSRLGISTIGENF